MRYFLSSIVTFIFLISCGYEESSVESVTNIDSLALVVQEWKEWAESSDDGLWEGDSSHRIESEQLYTFGGENDVSPPFFYPEAFAVKGDTIFVSDGSTQKLVAFNLSGEILWATAGIGEGPGYFTGVSQLTVLSDKLAVINLRSARIDLFNFSGDWLQSITALNIYDVQNVNDSLFLAVKQTSEEGCILLLNSDGEMVSSFGAWEEHMDGWSANRDLHCAVFNGEFLVLTSYYSDRIEIYDILEQNRILEFSRSLPIDIPKPAVENGLVNFNTVILDVFIGPEGMINTLLRPFSSEKTLDLQNGIADFCVIDRFNFDGEYLDSYVIPTKASLATYENGNLFVANEEESIISVYKISVGN